MALASTAVAALAIVALSTRLLAACGAKELAVWQSTADAEAMSGARASSKAATHTHVQKLDVDKDMVSLEEC